MVVCGVTADLMLWLSVTLVSSSPENATTDGRVVRVDRFVGERIVGQDEVESVINDENRSTESPTVATDRPHREYRGFINALLRYHPFKMKHG